MVSFDATNHILCPTNIAVRHEYRRNDVSWTVRILAYNPQRKEIRKRGKEAIKINLKKGDVRILSRPKSSLSQASLNAVYDILRQLGEHRLTLERLPQNHEFLKYICSTLKQRAEYDYQGTQSIKNLITNAKDAYRRAQIAVCNTEVRHECVAGACCEHYAPRTVTASTQTCFSIPHGAPEYAMRAQFKLEIDGRSITANIPYQTVQTRMLRVREFLERILEDNTFVPPTQPDAIRTGLVESPLSLGIDMGVQVDMIDFEDSLVGSYPIPSHRAMMDVSLTAFDPAAPTPHMSASTPHIVTSTPLLYRPESPQAADSISIGDDDSRFADADADMVTDEEVAL